jgi:hypothetical protein
MADNHLSLRNGTQERGPKRNSGSEIQHLLRAEEQILQSISGRAPLPETLHQICDALNLEIGNVISFFSLPSDPATDLAAIASSAALFGLYKFCSADVVDGNGELLGSLEMYSCVRRSISSLSDIPLIERATCLAAVAIKLHNEADGGIQFDLSTVADV